MDASGQYSTVQFRVPQTTLIQIKNNSKLVSNKSIKNKECRICLQSDESTDNQLISPCECKGSVQYIHVKCFNSWATKRYQQAQNRETFFSRSQLKCELCNEPYQFSYSTQFQCVSCRIFQNKISRLKLLAFVNVLFILIAIILLGVTSYYAKYDRLSQDYNIENPRYLLVYVAMVFSIISLVYGIFQFIKLFMLEQKLILRPSNKNKTIQINRTDTVNGPTLPKTQNRPNNLIVQYLG